jgi:predicted nucleic acid-binding protein
MMVIDASALIKIAITEQYSEEVSHLIYSRTRIGEPLLAPDIVLAEALNVLWVHRSLKKDIDDKQLEIAQNSVTEVFNKLEIFSTKTLSKDAMHIAKAEKLTFYDSLYLALSVKKGAHILSFDKQLVHVASKIGIKAITF